VPIKTPLNFNEFYISSTTTFPGIPVYFPSLDYKYLLILCFTLLFPEFLFWLREGAKCFANVTNSSIHVVLLLPSKNGNLC
jgi:predicted amidohydrolase